MEVSLIITQITNPAGITVSGEDFSVERIFDCVFQILEANVLCSIATVAPDNRAHINTAYFSYSEDLKLYFLSHPNASHCRNINTNSSMAMTVFSSSQKWGEPDQGLQMFGTCTPAQGIQETQARQLYGRRFPAYSSWKEESGEDDPGREYRFYRFLVSEVKVFDEKNLGGGLFVHANVMR